jgi:ribokinase
MKILNFGSLNIDHVYRVERFGHPGETLPCDQYLRGPGGKGLNQSIALAHAGMSVSHAGAVGADGEWLIHYLQDCQVDTTQIYQSPEATGHAIIQVTEAGENSILIHGGANRAIPSTHVHQVMESFGAEDVLLLQNEINDVPRIMDAAADRGMKIVFNPAPFTPAVVDEYPLERIDLFLINEIEGRQLTGRDAPADILDTMCERYGEATTVLTLGGSGAMYRGPHGRCSVEAEAVDVRDSTAAGDTFTGYFLAEILRDSTPLSALTRANKAASICVTRPGAAASIPRANELPG